MLFFSCLYFHAFEELQKCEGLWIYEMRMQNLCQRNIRLLGYASRQAVIGLRFEYDVQLIRHLKQHTTARRRASQKAWYLPDNPYYRKCCKLETDILGKEVLLKISAVNMPEFERYQNMLVLTNRKGKTVQVKRHFQPFTPGTDTYKTKKRLKSWT